MRLLPRIAAALLVGVSAIPLGAQEPAPAPAREPGPAAAAPAPDSALPFDPAVRTGTLENGVRYYVRRNARPEARAELRLVVDAGSVLEDEDQLGLAHFVEHMAFNGTDAFPRQELVRYLERIGMRFGPDVNAYTGFDETVYMLTVPTDTAGLLARGVEILAEWAARVAFDPEEVERERGVVIEEWREGRGAFARLRDQQLPVVLHGSRYAERLPIGELEVLQSARREALMRFYREWYRPGLVAVVAVGEFEPDSVEIWIRRGFASLPRPDAPRLRPAYGVPDHPRPLFVIASDPEAPRTDVTVYYKRDAEPLRTVGDYRRNLIERLFDGMLNARLDELARRPDPPFLGAFVGRGRLVRTEAAYVQGAAVAEDGVERGLAALTTEAERARRHGFTPTELERQKAELLRGYERAFLEREKTESEVFAAEYARAFLEEEPVPGIAAEYALVTRLLPGITLQEVNDLARSQVGERSRVVAVSAPEKPGLALPTEERLVAIFDSVAGVEIEPYADELADRPLVASPPEPGEIVEERRVEEIGALEWRLSNGVRVFLKPTDFKEDEIVLQAYSPGGTGLAAVEHHSTAANAPALLSQGGVGGFDRVGLEKKLAGKAVSLNPWVDELREGFAGQSSPRDLETLLQLVWLYAAEPRADTSAFLSLRQRIRSFLANRGASPEAHFQDTLTVTLADHHPRVRPMTPEVVEGWDLGVAYDFFRDRFGDASDFTFVLAGSFDPDSIRPLVRRWLGGLPAAGRVDGWRDPGIDPPEGVVRRVVRRGIEPKSRTAIVFTGSFPFSRENVFAFGAMAEALDIVLRERLREELGGTYGARLGWSVAREPEPEFQLRIDFGADPERLEELTAEAHRVVRDLAASGPAGDVLTRVKEQLRRARQTAERTNGFWANQIGNYDRNGWELAAIGRYDELVETLTAETVAAMARLLDPGRYVQVSLYPAKEPAGAGGEEAGPPSGAGSSIEGGADPDVDPDPAQRGAGADPDPAQRGTRR